MHTAMGRLGGTVTHVCTVAGVTRSATELGWIVSGPSPVRGPPKAELINESTTPARSDCRREQRQPWKSWLGSWVHR